MRSQQTRGSEQHARPAQHVNGRPVHVVKRRSANDSKGGTHPAPASGLIGGRAEIVEESIPQLPQIKTKTPCSEQQINDWLKPIVDTKQKVERHRKGYKILWGGLHAASILLGGGAAIAAAITDIQQFADARWFYIGSSTLVPVCTTLLSTFAVRARLHAQTTAAIELNALEMQVRRQLAKPLTEEKRDRLLSAATTRLTKIETARNAEPAPDKMRNRSRTV
jgi:hypothetical protein